MLRKRAFWIILVLLVIGAGGGYYAYHSVYAQAEEPVEPAIAGSEVRRGDLLVTAEGSGTLVPAAEIEVGFRTAGVLADLLVAVGDRVEAGQVLARLDDTDAQAELAQAEINLRQAELQLSKLTGDPDAAGLAGAQATVATAQADLERLVAPDSEADLAAAQENLLSAQEGLADLLAGPAAEEIAVAAADLELARMSLQSAQSDYDQVAWRSNVGQMPQSSALQQATINFEKAQANYDLKVTGATAEQLASARSKIAQAQSQLDALHEGPTAQELLAAQAKVDQAQAQLDALLDGTTAVDLELSQLSVDQAQCNLESAQRQLQQTILVAPSAGTVMAIKADPGEAVGTAAIITLADLDTPKLLFWVEESDLASVGVGNAVNIVFEALPDVTFPGKIASVDPALVTVDGTAAVQSWASVDLAAHAINLLAGMNAEVEIVAGEARDAILVPVQALREIAPDVYAVFVVDASGELEMRMVEVGLRDFVNAEILSGLETGEVVSTGIQEATTSAAKATTTTAQPSEPGVMRFLGGG